MAFVLLLCLQDPAPLERLLEDLRSDDIAVRVEAGASILKLGRPCVARLTHELGREQDAEVRTRISTLIDRLGPTVHELWAAGDVEAMLRKLAASEGAWDAEEHILRTKLSDLG